MYTIKTYVYQSCSSYPIIDITEHYNDIREQKKLENAVTDRIKNTILKVMKMLITGRHV